MLPLLEDPFHSLFLARACNIRACQSVPSSTLWHPPILRPIAIHRHPLGPRAADPSTAGNEYRAIRVERGSLSLHSFLKKPTTLGPLCWSLLYPLQSTTYVLYFYLAVSQLSGSQGPTFQDTRSQYVRTVCTSANSVAPRTPIYLH
jgi:hypothetical protein